MGRGWGATRAAAGIVALMLAGHTAVRAETCDAHDPASPARSAQITLGATDFTDDAHDELRSFVVTGSLGRVTAKIVAATPRGIVHSFSAAPESSLYSTGNGNQLKGIDIRVVLKHGAPGATVWVSLHQVCAQYFRNSFLY
ncbi:MAG: hypothetical protein ACREFB_16715 [Stellaceae bacterium]